MLETAHRELAEFEGNPAVSIYCKGSDYCTKAAVKERTAVLKERELALEKHRAAATNDPSKKLDPQVLFGVAVVVAACASMLLYGFPLKSGLWQNFQQQTLCSQTADFAYPSSVSDVSQIVQFYDKVSAVGAGHSWAPFACAQSLVPPKTKNVQVVMTGLDKVVDIDPTAMTVTVDAGVLCRALMKTLSARGFSLKTNANLVDQTIGGLVSTGTHGSALQAKSLSSSVRRLQVVHADGSVAIIDRDLQPELMAAYAISVGNLGVITQVTLDIIPDTPITTTLSHLSESELLRYIKSVSSIEAASQAGLEHQNIIWFPALRNVTVGTVKVNPPGWQLENPDGTGLPASNHNLIDQISDLPAPLTAVLRTLGFNKVSGVVVPLLLKLSPVAWETFARTNLEKTFWCLGNCTTSQGIYHSTPEYINLLASGIKYSQWEFAVPLSSAGQ
ncbi:hypothetical protein HDU91_000273, partial [Kappamyces sp. JEL0680]